MKRFFSAMLLLALVACGGEQMGSSEAPDSSGEDQALSESNLAAADLTQADQLDPDSQSAALSGLKAAATTRAVAWNRWESVLISSKDYSNPYRDVTVSVNYDGPNREHFEAYGFWDGGKTFRVRFMFPSEGKWRWRTTCSDASNRGLHDQGGEVTVTKPAPGNSLYTHGYLKVSKDRRYLTYGDGTAFFWMADTAWAAPVAATFDEWKSYVNKRKAQNFNVIQVHTGKAWFTQKELPANAFEGKGNGLHWNSDYWRKIDQMVKYANDQGLLVFFAAVRQPGDEFPTGDDGDLQAAAPHIRRFAQMFAARMMGSFVVFSPIADDEWTKMAELSGWELKNSSPIHLVTAHPRFKYQPALEAYHAKFTDFAGIQSGNGWRHDPYHHEDNKPFSATLAVQQAIEWSLKLSAKGTKPLLNLEMVYDGKDLQEGDNPDRYLQPYPSRLPRSTAYLSMLSGAKGITYGCSDVWSWGISRKWDGEDFAKGRAENFRVALSQDSAKHLARLFKLFSGLDWWRLVPNHELIQNQSYNWLTKMVMAITPDGGLGVAYLPDKANKEIKLQMNQFAGRVTARWFNPVMDLEKPEPGSFDNDGSHTFEKPDGWEDAVLILSAK